MHCILRLFHEQIYVHCDGNLCVDECNQCSDHVKKQRNKRDLSEEQGEVDILKGSSARLSIAEDMSVTHQIIP